jgi:3-methyladenine DNA glycosylase/8-oxoguanine DNA glycosylase
VSGQRYTFEEAVTAPFDFEATVQAHGWVALCPFVWERPTLYRIQRLTGGPVVRLGLSEKPAGSTIVIEVDSPTALTARHEAEIRQVTRRMLRLDEDLTDFYRLYDRLAGWQLKLKAGGGRLLRCPTLFEDIVCTLCTTNINWAGTIRMVDRLVAALGEPYPGQPDRRAFPTAAAIAVAGVDLLKQETGLGYRSEYLWRLAVEVAEGRLDLSRFENLATPTEQVRRELLGIKGVGPYAAATILMILGRYEVLAIDSELRAFAGKKYFQGQSPSEAQIRAIYEPWGRWQYLAYWFDVPA